MTNTNLYLARVSHVSGTVFWVQLTVLSSLLLLVTWITRFIRGLVYEDITDNLPFFIVGEND